MIRLPDFLRNIPEIKLDETKKKILIIYGSSALVLFMLYFFLFLKPSLAGLFDIIPKTRGLKTEIVTVENDLAHKDRLKKKLDDLEKMLGDFEKKFSREKELPKLLEDLSQTARNSRVKILGITPVGKKSKTEEERAAKEAVYDEVPISISAQSGYHELGAFINKLEQGERYMQISSMEIKANKTNLKRHDVEFTVYAYTFKSGSGE